MKEQSEGDVAKNLQRVGSDSASSSSGSDSEGSDKASDAEDHIPLGSPENHIPLGSPLNLATAVSSDSLLQSMTSEPGSMTGAATTYAIHTPSKRGKGLRIAKMLVF